MSDPQPPIRILIVDDEAAIRLVLARALERAGYRCAAAGDAAEALALVAEQPFELALVDIMMPGGSGLDFLEGLRRTSPDTAAIMVTAVDRAEVARRALELGAYGYIIKPFETNEVRIAVLNALRRRELELASRSHAEELARTVAARTAALQTALDRLGHVEREIRLSREETIQRLTRAAEFRDNETAQHIQRMSHYSRLLGRLVGFDETRCDLLRLAASMHDVGKIGTPDDILLKPGRLTDTEMAIMRRHCAIGHGILDGSGSELLAVAATIALTHHERVDGSGYPHGLTGEQIPLEGRLTAVADVYDALTSRRVYKAAYASEQAVSILREGRGTHFDGDLVDLFVAHLDEALRIAERYRDAASELREAG